MTSEPRCTPDVRFSWVRWLCYLRGHRWVAWGWGNRGLDNGGRKVCGRCNGRYCPDDE